MKEEKIGLVHTNQQTYEEDIQHTHYVQPTAPYASPSVPRHFNEEDKEEVICRCCHGGFEEGEDFIAPCRCAGSIKFVHRHCLDTWRAVSQNPDSFYRCDICHDSYQFEQLASKNSTNYCSYMKYGFLVTVDISVILLIWQALVVLCAVFVHFVDHNNVRMKKFPAGAPVLGVDYLFGLLLFFLLLGILGVTCGFMFLVAKCCGLLSSRSGESYTYNTYPYTHYNPFFDPFFTYLCFWNMFYMSPADRCCLLPCYACADIGTCDGCDCTGSTAGLSGLLECSGGGGGSSDNNPIVVILGVIALIILVALIVLGVAIGVVLMTLIVVSTLKRRYSIIRMKDQAAEYRVKDLVDTH
jgi:hypothetical protein